MSSLLPTIKNMYALFKLFCYGDGHTYVFYKSVVLLVNDPAKTEFPGEDRQWATVLPSLLWSTPTQRTTGVITLEWPWQLPLGLPQRVCPWDSLPIHLQRARLQLPPPTLSAIMQAQLYRYRRVQAIEPSSKLTYEYHTSVIISL